MIKWFDGKKVVIGATMLWVADVILRDILIGQYQIDPIWLRLSTDIMAAIGKVLVPVGIIHKGYKKVKNGKNPS